MSFFPSFDGIPRIEQLHALNVLSSFSDGNPMCDDMCHFIFFINEINPFHRNTSTHTQTTEIASIDVAIKWATISWATCQNWLEKLDFSMRSVFTDFHNSSKYYNHVQSTTLLRRRTRNTMTAEESDFGFQSTIDGRTHKKPTEWNERQKNRTSQVTSMF